LNEFLQKFEVEREGTHIQRVAVPVFRETLRDVAELALVVDLKAKQATRGLVVVSPAKTLS
jgi:alkyl hydroperoxide reductase subunit AhpC